jgi:hypothetical protein
MAAGFLLASHVGDPELAALAGLVSVADRLPYFDGEGSAALAVLTAPARTFLSKATVVDQRAAIGQDWVKLQRITLAAPSVELLFALTGGYSEYRIRGRMLPNPAISNPFNVVARIRTDGATDRVGASDYAGYGPYAGAGGTGAQATTVSSLAVVATQTAPGSPDVGIGPWDIDISQGGASKRLRLKSRGSAYAGAGNDYYVFDYHAEFTSPVAATHLRLLGSVAGNVFGAGTEMTLEGLE